MYHQHVKSNIKRHRVKSNICPTVDGIWDWSGSEKSRTTAYTTAVLEVDSTRILMGFQMMTG